MKKLSTAEETALTRFLQQLVQTASFSGMEGGVAQLIVHEMEALDFDDVTIDDMGNVIGRIGSGEPPFLAVYADMDTVGIGDIAAWEFDPFGGVVENGMLYGRGAANPKAGLASAIYAAKLLKAAGVPKRGTVLVIGGVFGEAAEGVAAKYVFEQLPEMPKWVLLTAATDLNVNIGQRGRMEMNVTVQGKACHASTPDMGVNAIYGAARIIFSLELMRTMLGHDTFMGDGSMAVTHIENIERTKNVIPDRCNFVIDRRLTMGETEAHAIADVQSLLAKEAVEGNVQVTQFHTTSYTGKVCEARKSYPAWVTDQRDSLVRSVSKSVQRALGTKPQLASWSFSTAGVYSMGTAGIPTVGFGPGREKYAHTTKDRVRLRDCFVASEAYVRIIADLMK